MPTHLLILCGAGQPLLQAKKSLPTLRQRLFTRKKAFPQLRQPLLTCKNHCRPVGEPFLHVKNRRRNCGSQIFHAKSVPATAGTPISHRKMDFYRRKCPIIQSNNEWRKERKAVRSEFHSIRMTATRFRSFRSSLLWSPLWQLHPHAQQHGVPTVFKDIRDDLAIDHLIDGDTGVGKGLTGRRQR